MIKKLSFYTIPKGVDGDEFWKFQTQIHAQDAKAIYGPRIKRYVLNRLIKVQPFGQRGVPYSEQKPPDIADPKNPGFGEFFCMVESYWENEHAIEIADAEAAKTIMAYNGKTLAGDMQPRFACYRNGFVDEVVVIP